MALDIRLRDGRIVRRGRLLVAVPQTAVPPLHPEVVERTRRKLRREREPEK
jgi:hypothetical protein